MATTSSSSTAKDDKQSTAVKTEDKTEVKQEGGAKAITESTAKHSQQPETSKNPSPKQQQQQQQQQPSLLGPLQRHQAHQQQPSSKLQQQLLQQQQQIALQQSQHHKQQPRSADGKFATACVNVSSMPTSGMSTLERLRMERDRWRIKTNLTVNEDDDDDEEEVAVVGGGDNVDDDGEETDNAASSDIVGDGEEVAPGDVAEGDAKRRCIAEGQRPMMKPTNSTMMMSTNNSALGSSVKMPKLMGMAKLASAAERGAKVFDWGRGGGRGGGGVGGRRPLFGRVLPPTPKLVLAENASSHDPTQTQKMVGL